MELRLYNTKTKTVQPLQPVNPGHVGIYLCGPTVQGSPHIGHLRAAVCFDVLVRWLGRYGLDVTYVRNVTDIDDKILINADKNDENWWQLAYRFEREFSQAYDSLGLLPPTYEPHAAAHIIDQIELVQILVDRGHAYPDGQGNVYFDVHSQPDYGSLTNQKLEDMRSTEDPNDVDALRESGKKDPRDFALWKARKEGEPETASWESPWGLGRPGWHLECSAMSRRYLGDNFDIHGGGIDLRFPHHENEQAQSHAAGWDFANLWVHNAWVTMKDEKMSKSLGNTLSLGNLLESYPPAVIRFALGTVHYRSMIEWDEQTLVRAQAAWEKLSSFVSDAGEIVGQPDDIALTPDLLPPPFTAALNDDLNVAGAMAAVYEHMKIGRKALAENDQEIVAKQLLLVRSMLDVLGVDPASQQWSLEGRSSSSNDGGTEHAALDTLVMELVGERNQARADKNWATADQIRDKLAAAGISIEDGPHGSTWKVG